MKPMVHARISAKKFGGVAEDYLAIHDFMDCTKMALPDIRHRMMLHNAVGCFIAEKVFGHTITNSDNKTVHVRDVAEAHVIEDLGFIPTLEKCFAGMPIESWMGGKVSKYKEESQPQAVSHIQVNPIGAASALPVEPHKFSWPTDDVFSVHDMNKD